MLIYGMGELHLEVVTHRMLRDFGVNANVGKPRVAYRQRLNGVAKSRQTFERQMGGKNQFAEIEVQVEPVPGEGFVYEDRSLGTIPKVYLASIESGCEGAMTAGIGHGFELIDTKVTLLSGAFRDEDSTDLAFSVCATQAVEAAAEAAGVSILEPIMRLEVTTPPEYLSAIIGDLNKRRAQVASIETTEDPNVIHADVPLGEVFGYASVVPTLSQGRGAYSMEPKEYAPVPEEMVAKIAWF